MERVIEFKAKRVDAVDLWTFGVPVESVNGKAYIVHGATEDAINTSNDVDFYFTEVIPKTVREFINSHDRHGTRIYRGDIVHFDNGLKDDVGNYVVDVFYDGLGLPQYGIRQDDGGWHFVIPKDQIEVIGNIHDNPELLKTE